VKPLIIVGTGLAGYSLASEYRKLDASREIIMICADNGSQYSKPMLSTALTQKKTANQLVIASAQEMASRLNATVLSHQHVLSITSSKRLITTTAGQFHYGDLVLALGADTISTQLQGDGVDDIMPVNDLAQYTRLREALMEANRVLIIGAGLIGCEFANDLLSADITPFVVDPNPTPLSSLTPSSIGRALKDGLEAAGVVWHLNTKVDRVDHDQGQYLVTLLNGDTVKVDVVISAIGLRPRIELAKTAGIATGKGILVDGYGQTSVPGVFALGDCAEYSDGRLMPYVRPTLIAARSIAATLAGTLTRIDFPAMAITVKTSKHPVVVLSPRPAVAGQWSVQQNVNLEHWLYKDEDDRLHGFALSGEAAKGHASLTKMVGSQYPAAPVP
jgi:rubredoxin-NAD+ reductase